MSRSAAVVLALLLTASCARGSGDGGFALDGSIRVPDDEGIVTAVDLESVTLDEERTYEVDRELASFSAIDLSTVPLLFTEGQYVQVGTDGDRLVWLSAFAKPLAGDRPLVVFAGEVDLVDDGAIEFDNGTVLRLAPGVDTAELTGVVHVGIDPRSNTVTEVLS
jgi:hypothetical protein